MKNKKALVLLLLVVVMVIFSLATIVACEDNGGNKEIPHEHSYGTLIADAATCTTEGMAAHYKCEGCNKLFVKEGDAYVEKTEVELMHKLAHTLTHQDAVVATCVATGKSEYWTCSGCEKFFSDQQGTTEVTEASLVVAIDPTNHTGLSHENAVVATCVATGKSEYWTCSGCEKFFSDQQGTTEVTEASLVVAIDPTNHTGLAHEDAVVATCVAAGKSEYWTCSGCEKFFSDQQGTTEVTEASLVVAIDPTNHTGLSHENAVAATCVAAGKSEYWTCSGCEKFFSDQGTTEVTEASLVVAIDPDKHVNLTHKDAKAATISTNSNIEYWVCECEKCFADKDANTELQKSDIFGEDKIALSLVGTWTGTTQFNNNDSGWAILEDADATQYVISATISVASPVTDGGSRPGLVVAGNDTRVYAIAYSNNWIGKVDRSVSDLNDWGYGDDYLQLAKGLESSVVMTVLRNGGDFYLFLDGVYIKKYQYTVGENDTLVGLFNNYCNTTFADFDVDVTTETYNTWIAKTITKNLISKGNWVESEGSYTNDATGGYKVLDLVDSTKYVVKATISLTAALPGGARPGVVVAANDNYVLAVAFCDSYLGLAKRTTDDTWDVPGGYVSNTTLTTGETPSCTLTVLRDGQDFYAFINDQFIKKYSYAVDSDGEGAYGLFNIGAAATFTNYSVSEASADITTYEGIYDTWLAAQQPVLLSDGTWNLDEGTGAYTVTATEYGGYKVLERVDTAKYIVTSTITVPQAVNYARPGVIVAANDTYVFAVAYFGDSITYVRRSPVSNDWNPIVTIGTDSSLKNSPFTTVLKVARDGQTFYVFVNDTYLCKFTYDGVSATGDGAYGFFNFESNTSFTNYSIDETSANVDALVLLAQPKKLVLGDWTENSGVYSNDAAGGYKVLERTEATKYVVSATISLTAALPNGARPGVIVAANDSYVLAVAFCDSWIGLAKRTGSVDWDIQGEAYVTNATLTTGAAPSCTLTVLRDGQSFHTFIDGTFIKTYTYGVDANGDGGAGLFNIGAVSSFSNFSLDATAGTIATWETLLPKE